MTSIHTLVPDVYALLQEKGGFDAAYNTYFADSISNRLNRDGNSQHIPSLRLSKMGDCCPRHLWYSVHRPELAQPLPPWAIFKLTYGHIIEALALTLAKDAGHRVEGEQDELELLGIKGHRDAVIDGVIVDVKSTTSYTLEKARRRAFSKDDAFSNLDQLDGYVLASASDPLVLDKEHGYLWYIDKTLGHMHVYEHTIRAEHIVNRITDYKAIVERESEPACTCGTQPIGQSGNVKLDVRASYSPFKYQCFPNLRCFLYSDGPVYLTEVAKRPEYRGSPIPEIDRDGKYVYR